MTLNELRYLVAVAQERNFGRAAQKCFVSQPALSVAIQKLEEELGEVDAGLKTALEGLATARSDDASETAREHALGDVRVGEVELR